MVSAFIESKRVLDGIRAVARMPNAFLVVAGDGPLRDEAQALANSLMPDRYLRVSLTANEMPTLYKSADVFLHLSELESFGNVFLEAWACGLPIVAHDTERLRWILGDYGQLCDTMDEEQLVRSLETAADSPPRAVSEGIERYSWANIAQEYRSFISTIQSI
jgi:glycosyltransferase involved in cell wall biosynthesis